ncbi:MAG: DUF1648 domain-containing protein [Cellulomonadaceae bacterium]|jgi:hypothetical protein|nr:DUF1648 domain-containing protein [Cellulomonadaceae bacterium]
MKAGEKHLIIGTVICALMGVLFFALRSRLPAQVPLQFRLDGTSGNHIPRDLFVFGLPLVFAALNLAFSKQFLDNSTNVTARTLAAGSTLKFYIVPAIVVLLSILTLVFTLR